MTTLSDEEIAYMPVVDTESATDTKRKTWNRLQLTLCIVLGIIIFIQFISIVTPGWSIITSEAVSAYQSVYYATACIRFRPANKTEWECHTRSFHDMFQEQYSAAKDYNKPAKVRTYNLVVRYQMNIQIAWLLTVGTLIFQFVKLIRPNESFPRLTVINVVALACACPMMYQVLFKNFVEIDNTRRMSEFGETNVGFPYSFVFYVFTFAMTIASLVLIVKQVYDNLREKNRIHAEMKVKYDRLQLEYDAEVESFKRFRRNLHLRPPSRGSYNEDRRSRGSHSPRNSREINDRDTRAQGSHDNGRDPCPRRPDHYQRPHDRSPRPRDRSPPRDHSYRDHSPRHSPRPRNRSPPREDRRNHSPRSHSPPREDHRNHSPRSHSPPGDDRRNHSPRNRSPPRQDRGNRTSRNRSPPRQDRGNHSPQNRSPPRENRETQSSQNRSPPPEDPGHFFPQNSEEHDNPALVLTPPSGEHSEIAKQFDNTSSTPLVDVNKVVEVDGNGTKADEIELSIAQV